MTKATSGGGIIRVAAYCRVSTDSPDQANSLESQQRYFSEMIGRNPLWELYRIYVDEGISGTDTKKRKAFNEMIDHAREHRFDLIVTKEISRFARNTLDSIGYTRELKRIGIGVYFMNDNINTLDPDAELRLTILSSISQEESRKTSERCKWGQRRMMEQGVVFGRDMLGYDVRNGKLFINEDGAAIVRRIFCMYLDEGKGAHLIAKRLREEGVKTARFMKDWSYTTIMRVLKNEKYCGDLVQQKTFTPDYLTHAKKRNRGELDPVVIRDHHEPIVSREVFDAVQQEIARRRELCKSNAGYADRYALSGKIQCGRCGGRFIHVLRKRGNGNDRYESWSCIRKLRYGCIREDADDGASGCDNVNVSYRDLKEALTFIVSRITRDHQESVARLTVIVKGVLREPDEDDRISYFEKQIGIIADKKQKLLDMCLSGDIETAEYKKGYERLDAAYRETVSRLAAEKEKSGLCKDRPNVLGRIREHIEEVAFNRRWDEAFYRAIIDQIVVFGDRSLSVQLSSLKCSCRVRILKGREIAAYTAQKVDENDAFCT